MSVPMPEQWDKFEDDVKAICRKLAENCGIERTPNEVMLLIDRDSGSSFPVMFALATSVRFDQMTWLGFLGRIQPLREEV